jgi:hypothetical protein
VGLGEHFLQAWLTNVRETGIHGFDDCGVDVAAGYLGALTGEQRRQRQTDLAEAYDRDSGHTWMRRGATG